jgi:glyoxylase-like metal-dependent hydrolase (beta-lactamase superfamily II)
LNFLGRPGVIATGVIETPAGVLLVDPGPGSCLPRLTEELRAAGIGIGDVSGVLATHIHLDHSGATGLLVRQNPNLTVYVHERGAPHVMDPSKLVASATRIYGGDMDRLWGEFAPVPAANIRALSGGESLRFGTSVIETAYTPGHASHHVTYCDASTGIVFTGDVAGIRVGHGAYVLPPTPPPDIDLGLWRRSLSLIRDWQPSGVFVTHFGLHADALAHLDLVLVELDTWERVSRDLIDTADPSAREQRFVDGVAARIVERVGAEQAAAYRAAVSLEHCWAGLARYWSKRLVG